MITKRKFFNQNGYTFILILSMLMVPAGIVSAIIWDAANLVITGFGIGIGLITWFKGSQSYNHLKK